MKGIQKAAGTIAAGFAGAALVAALAARAVYVIYQVARDTGQRIVGGQKK